METPNNYRLFFILLTLLLITFVPSETRSQDNKERVRSLNTAMTEAMKLYDYPSAKKYGQLLLHEPAKLIDPSVEGYANYCIGVAELFDGSPDEAEAKLNEALRIGKEIGNDSVIGLALNSLGILEASVRLNYSLAQYYFLSAIDYPNMRGSVDNNLSELSIIQKDTTGIKYAMEAYELGLKNNNPHGVYTAAVNLSLLYNLKHNNETAKKFHKIAVDLAIKHNYKGLGLAYVAEAAILNGERKEKEALEAINQGIEILKTEQPFYLPKAYLQQAYIYFEGKQYEKSIESLEKAISAANEFNSFSENVEIFELLADNYEMRGNAQKALEYMRQAKNSADSAKNSAREQLIRERDLIMALADIEKEKAVADVKASQQRIRIIILSILSAFLIFLIVILVINLIKKHKLYKEIVKSNVNFIEKKNELRLRIKNLISDNHNGESNNLEKVQEESPGTWIIKEEQDEKNQNSLLKDENYSKLKNIYERVCKVMEEENLYRDRNFTREQLLEKIETNPTYLAQAIKQMTGKNYSQFVNNYRIEEAIQILSDPAHQSMTLKEICESCGFLSVSNFYKLFQDATGLSPALYRQTYKKL